MDLVRAANYDESLRAVPWLSIGKSVDGAITSKDAMIMAGLDWTVSQYPFAHPLTGEKTGYIANVRDDSGDILGVVSKDYRVVQNVDAFEFLDSIIGDGISYETAGMFRGGKALWLLAKLPEVNIVGDKVVPYICLTNSHDRSGGLRVALTPIRVLCQNALAIAWHDAIRTWSTKHTGDLASKMHEARVALLNTEQYMDEMAVQADILANKTITLAQQREIITKLFPIDSDKDSAKKIERIEEARTLFGEMLKASDNKKFEGTGWGIINAAADFTSHASPARVTSLSEENRWARIIDGNNILNKATGLVLAA